MEIIKKAYAPIILIVFGLGFVLYGFISEQHPMFMLGAFAFLVAGAIALMSSLDMFNQSSRKIIVAVLILASISLSWLNYKAIKDPMDFNKEKKRRYAYVVQNLKDLRHAQLSYKGRYGEFCGTMDSLMDFIKFDSVLVVKSIGEVPDGLTREQAIDSGYVQIDTNKVPTAAYIYNDKYLSERKVPFSVDSLPFVPFSGGVVFAVEAGMIERGKVEVPVFLITDSAPFDKKDIMMVGSMTDPSTSGNWGE